MNEFQDDCKLYSKSIKLATESVCSTLLYSQSEYGKGLVYVEDVLNVVKCEWSSSRVEMEARPVSADGGSNWRRAGISAHSGDWLTWPWRIETVEWSQNWCRIEYSFEYYPNHWQIDWWLLEASKQLKPNFLVRLSICFQTLILFSTSYCLERWTLIQSTIQMDLLQDIY